eukprot:1671144-Amphidinium_carterae.1
MEQTPEEQAFGLTQQYRGTPLNPCIQQLCQLYIPTMKNAVGYARPVRIDSKMITMSESAREY